MPSLPRYVNIKDSTTLVRDTFSMGVINTNSSAYEEAKTRHQIAMQKLAEERRREHELNTLRREVDELKALVQQVLVKKNG
jgi:hypothetical protein